MSPLLPAGPAAARIADLTYVIFGLAAVVFIVVESLLLFAVLRFRRAQVSSEPKQIYGNAPLEAVWTAVPALILAVLLAFTLRTMSAVAGPARAAPAQGAADAIQVIGHQWWWEVRYPGAQISTANEIHIAVGQPVHVDVSSTDVIHSFWVPQLQGKIDVIPGRINATWLQADRPGVYRGQCAEFCGDQHARMALLVVADPADQFSAWLEDQQQPAAPPTDPQAQQGVQVFARVGCITCHTIRWGSTGAGGTRGPDLTHVGSRRTLAAGTLPNTPGTMAGWIANPQALKPGSDMPNLNLNGDDLQALLALLEGLR